MQYIKFNRKSNPKTEPVHESNKKRKKTKCEILDSHVRFIAHKFSAIVNELYAPTTDEYQNPFCTLDLIFM